jgi:hypothetical protein
MNRLLLCIRSLTVFLIVAGPLGFGAPSVLAYGSENVVLVVIDGLRYTEGLGDPSHTYVPEMWALAQQGSIIEPFQNDGVTSTWRAIPAIWCGAWTEVYKFNDPDCGGQENNYSELPTVFEYYRKGLSRPVEDCVYVLKDVGCTWKASFDPDYGPDYWPLYHSTGSTDLDVWHEAEMILNTYTPSFSLLYFAGVDHAGHSGDWNYYTSSIAVADSIVGMLWEFLQAHPSYAGTTTMFVTNDHGRHTSNFSGHGDGCDGCRTIQLLAVGPDIEIGHISDVPRTLPDITPTIGELLGFPTENATGTSMMEILCETAVGVEDDLGPSDRFKIAAVPNPFNPGVSIEFRIPEASSVQLTIFDVSGRRVAIVADGHYQRGKFVRKWDGRDDSGREVGSGTYFAKIAAEKFTATKKIVLIR